MFSLKFQKSKLNLPEKDWKVISSLISKPNSILLGSQENIEFHKLLALGTQMNLDGTGIFRRLTYHTCQTDPVAITEWDQSPSTCPCCNKAMAEKDLGFDFEIIVKYPLTLE